jgi:ATP synthase protein I
VAEQSGKPDKDQEDRGEQQRAGHETNESAERESAALRARLEKLSSALDSQRLSAAEPGRGEGSGQPSAGGMGSAMSLAFRVMSEFISAVIVGGLIGWGIDRLAGTSPAFLIVFVLFGAAAGFWNVYRIGTEKPGSGRG